MRWMNRLRPVIACVLAAALLWTGSMPGGQASAADGGTAITVQEALSRNNDGSAAKVQGYVIGQVPSGGAFSAYTLDPAKFAQDTNVIIADNTSETNPDNMLVVQIPIQFRAEFGPNTNKSLYHTQLIIGGTLTAYFGKKGLKDSSSFEKVQSVPSAQAAAVTANPSSGAVSAGTLVALSSPSVSAAVYSPTVSSAVYYTLSNSVDKSSFVPYTGPIPITGETTISAYAARDGLQDSGISTFRYTLLDAVVLSDIATARVQPANTPVRIQGIVTYREESGGFANLYVQDATGGIVVRGSGVTADVGDEIEAFGPITLYNGLVQIEKDKAGFTGGTITVVRSGVALPAPTVLTGSDFAPAAGGGKGEGGRYEGMLVSVRNVAVTRGSGTTWYASDAQGKELTIYAKNALSSFALGTAYEQLTGVLTYHTSYGLELLPRSAADAVRELLSVQASVPSGGIVRGGSVGLSTPQTGAAIHYTIDGTTPTVASTVYGAPIVINVNTTIQAIAVLGDKVSPVYTFTYTPVDQLDGLRIHDIQGAGHRSPYSGLPLTGVEGIVTTVVNTNSFYLQELPGQEDASNATSEAIRVYRPSSGVSVGDRVTVSGTVNEYAPDASQLTATEIMASAVTVVSSGNPLPAPVKLGKGGRIIPSAIDSDGLSAFNPETDAIDFDESLEWMRVQLDNATITGPYASDTGVSVIVGNDPANPLRTPAGGVILKQDGPDYESALNPQRMFVSTNPTQPVKTGDSFSGPIIGVMTYSGGSFKVVPSVAVPAVVDGGLRPAAATLPQDADKLTVATFNVENFAASSPARASQIAAIVTDKLHSPDIVALMEIQDNNGAANDGTVDAGASFQALIDAIAAKGGPAYSYTDIAPVNNMDGGEGGGNIRVGFLYQANRVTLKSGKPKGDAVTPVAVGQDGSLSLNPGRIDPGNDAFTASRKPLAAEFEFRGERVVAIANHFNSKGGDQKPFGAVQPAVRSTEAQRAKQAAVVNGFVKQLQDRDPSVNVVVLGDLNDFQFSRTLDIVKGGGKQLTNLVDKLPENERYSYIYEGNSQTLDHILVNPALADFAQLEIVHVNADFEEADGRVSDHDPLLAQLDVQGRSKNRFDLRVLHTNDTHAHLDNIARRVTAIKQARTANSLLLDAGDVFSGTLYFNQYNGLADLWFMNKVGYDAMTFGNHEFDKGPATLKTFVQGAQFPFVSANIDYGTDPDLSPLFSGTVGTSAGSGHIYPSIIKEVNGEKIGIFGLTTPDTAALSSPGDKIAFQYAKSSAEAAVAALKAKGVNKIIALSHIGFSEDEKLADEVDGIDIIVGGHSHTKLPAPVVHHADREPTIIVQTGEYAANLGLLDATFDANGVLTAWNGKLIEIDAKDTAGNYVIAADAEAAAKLAEYAAPLEQLKKTVIGKTVTVLDGERGNVRKKETNLGDLMADGMLAKVKSLVPQAADVQGYVTIQNGGGIRASIDAGDITLGELLTVMPFGNNLTALKMTGAEIAAALENGVSGVQTGEGRFPQVAGMRFYYDSTKQGEVVDSVTGQTVKTGQRITKVQIKNADGTYSDMKPDAYYIVATNSFMADGGDFYRSMKQAKTAGRLYELNLVDYEVFREYLDTIGEVNRSTEGRITDVSANTNPNPGSNPGTGSGSGGTSAPGTEKPATDKPATGKGGGSGTNEGTGSGDGSAPAASFSDVPADYWAAKTISRAIKLGIVTGYPDDTFRPGGTATRAEFAAMLSRALGLPAAAGEPKLADWSRIPAWARPFVAQAVEAGIVNGYADGTFRPSDKITRTEMAVMLVRALNLKVGGGKASDLPFEDASDIPAWAAPYIAAAYDAGLIQGADGKFKPNAEATRAEVVTMLLAVIDYMGK
ncbi:S-layer homology domain-containing protein [Paenibacillus kobensis]|uniref:S-layer homology domain-containing protein n=1 Tax=Paenibacillus kobensis TaxID=59841 RepID=UPI0013E2B27C|nr:S-layer homology domain-containing protein [Paenibacillus kobensis]